MRKTDRTRTRTIVQSLTNQNGYNFFPPGLTAYETITEGPLGFVDHFRVRPYTGPYFTSYNNVDRTMCYQCTYVETFGSFQGLFMTAASQAGFPPIGINRSKIASTNEFGLLQFFAELDDTVALFSKKLLKTMTSYGGITWGILPFVSEMSKLFKAYEKRLKEVQDQKYEDTLSLQKTVALQFWPGSFVDVSVLLERRLAGNLSHSALPSVRPIIELLDRIGFHPDIGTAYDLIPFSFVVDYFFPLGNMIESVRPRGWVNNLYFSGFQSDTYTFHCTPRNISSGVYSWYSNGKRYIRRYHTDTIIPNAGPIVSEPEISLKNLFSTAYLLHKR